MSQDRIDWRKVMDPSEIPGYNDLARKDQRIVGESLRALKGRLLSGTNGLVRIEDSIDYKPNLIDIDQTLINAGITLKLSSQRDESGRIVIIPKTFEELEAKKQRKGQEQSRSTPSTSYTNPLGGGGDFSDFFNKMFGLHK